MEKYYSSEKNVQILIALLKNHGIRKIVISPGTTNMSFVASVQQDAAFEIYSSVDERSAAYIACGLAAESGEVVALSCTGATASRNYIPGLTEAFYRKLPILAITSTQHIGRVGHNMEQIIDRSNVLNDMVKLSVQIPTIHDAEDEWAYTVAMNKAILELKHRGGGPVHINLATTYSQDFSVKSLPKVQTIQRVCDGDVFPELAGKKIAIFVGEHAAWGKSLVEMVERFCEEYNAVVLCDHTSKYKGKYAVYAGLVTAQERYQSVNREMDILIHLGNVSGAHFILKPKQVWRVNPDGEIRDTFRKLSYVFEMREEHFFEKYLGKSKQAGQCTYAEEFHKEYLDLYNKIPEIPFSNIWIAKQMANQLPANSIIHFGILNSLRSWNFFEIPNSVLGYSNTGGFGIDGCISSLLGASLANKDKLHFGIVGDLAFFYDMNSLGNRHFSKNIRLMIINNGCGTEFKHYTHGAYKFGEAADAYIAAVGHFGCKSKDLIRDYALNLGCDYYSATNKEEFLSNMEPFLTENKNDRPIIFEVFTDSKAESEALYAMKNLEISTTATAKKLVRDIIGDKGVASIKRVLNGK